MNSVLEQAVELFNNGEAAACLKHLQQFPQWQHDAEGHVLAGAAAHILGDEMQARQAYRQALQLQPQHAMASFNLALLEVQSDRFGPAIELLEPLLEYYPGFADARLLLADCYQQEGRKEDGVRQFVLLLEQAPDDMHVRAKFSQYLNIIGSYARAALVAPPTGEGLLQLATACVYLHCPVDGERLARLCCAAADAPANAEGEALRLQGLAHMLKGHYQAAITPLEQAMAAGAHDQPLSFALGWCYLATGHFEQGWPLFRLRHAESWCRALSIPEWNGEDLRGKNILVHSEQGVGDIIFGLRYLPLLAARAGRVLFSTYPDVLELLRHEQRTTATAEEESEAAPAQLHAAADGQAEADYQVRLMDLPALFGTRMDHMPVEVPYLFPSASKVQEWQQRVGSSPRLRVGLVWAGNARQANDVYRSTSLQDWQSLAAVPGVDWFCLQKGPPLAQLQSAPLAWDIREFDADIHSFADTAALIAQLDVVITVCTSVAHLAGAMGREVWVLVTHARPDFRWPEGAQHTPWYPSARLFRRQAGMTWAQLIATQVQPALAQRVLDAGHAPQPWSQAALQWLLTGDASELEPLQPTSDEALPAVLLQRELRAKGCNIQWPAPAGLPLPVRLEQELETVGTGFAAARQCLQQLPQADWPALFFLQLGQRALDEKLLSEAMDMVDAGLQAWPRVAELHLLRGRVLLQGGDLQAAHAAFAQAFELAPHHFSIANHLGYILQVLNRLDEAVVAYQRAVQLDPERYQPWVNLGMIAAEQNNDAFAEVCWRRVDALRPDWMSHMHLGVLLTRRRDFKGALPHFEQAALLAPDDHQHHQNLASCLRDLGEDIRAIAAWRRAVELNPQATGAWMGLGWMLLERGDMQAGWQAYAQGLADKGYSLPRWDGSPLAGRSLLVVQDQGYGDLFQFVCLVARIEGRVTLAVNHAASSLLQDQQWPFPVIRIDDIDWQGGGFDCYVEQMRLPALMQVDLCLTPPAYPYLQVSADHAPQLRATLQSDALFKVGFVWSGSSRFAGNATRSTHLSDWTVIKELAGVHFYSLQKDAASNQALDYPDLPLINLGAQCNSFADTAAVMMELDLVISTCTAVAHLAGALGRPTWVLLTCDHPDWRWLRERDDCPWYPSVRLFRQQPGEPWSAVLRRVMQELVRLYPQVSWVEPS